MFYVEVKYCESVEMGKSRFEANDSEDKRGVEIYWKNISYRRNLACCNCRVMDVGSDSWILIVRE